MTKKIGLAEIGSFLEKLAEKSESVYWLSSPAYEKIWGRSRELLYSDPELWSAYLHPDDVKEHHPGNVCKKLSILILARKKKEN